MPPAEWLMRRPTKKVFGSSQQFHSPFSLSLSLHARHEISDKGAAPRRGRRKDGGGLNTTAYSFIHGPTNQPTNRPTSASYGPSISSEHLNSEVESTDTTLVLKLSPGRTTLHMREGRSESGEWKGREGVCSSQGSSQRVS